MLKLTLAFILVAIATPTIARAVEPAAPYVGMRLIAANGEGLGRFDCNSLGNPRSPYGNEWNSASIWDPRGEYGRPYSPLSPFNRHTMHPPRLVDDEGETAVWVSLNANVDNVLDPFDIINWLVVHCASFHVPPLARDMSGLGPP